MPSHQQLYTCRVPFSERVGEWAKILRVGAILAPGKQTVTSTLHMMGLSQERQHGLD